MFSVRSTPWDPCHCHTLHETTGGPGYRVRHSSDAHPLLERERSKSRGTTAMVFMDILWVVSKDQKEMRKAKSFRGNPPSSKLYA